MIASLILGLDCTEGSCSVALCDAASCQAEQFEIMSRGQAEALIPMLADVMQQAGADYADLAAIACGIGPGSYTGLRIAMATAQGLALARGIPAIGIPSLQAVAFAARHTQTQKNVRIYVASATRRADIYWQIFDVNAQPVSVARVGKAADLRVALANEDETTAPILLLGTAAEGIKLDGLDHVQRGAISPQTQMVQARDIALLAWRILPEAGGAAAFPANQPLYLKPADASPAPPLRVIIDTENKR